MHIGVGMFATDYAIPIDELARETEARGFESLWVPEHTHIPTSRRTPWPGDSELPLEYNVAADPKLIGMYQEAEVTRIILRLPSEGRDTILPLLDQYATFLR